MNEPVYLFSRIAFRHDIDEADTLHALRNAIGQWHLDAEPPDRPDVRLLSCLLYTSPSPRDRTRSRMPSSA